MPVFYSLKMILILITTIICYDCKTTVGIAGLLLRKIGSHFIIWPGMFRLSAPNPKILFKDKEVL